MLNTVTPVVGDTITGRNPHTGKQYTGRVTTILDAVAGHYAIGVTPVLWDGGPPRRPELAMPVFVGHRAVHRFGREGQEEWHVRHWERGYTWLIVERQWYDGEHRSPLWWQARSHDSGGMQNGRVQHCRTAGHALLAILVKNGVHPSVIAEVAAALVEAGA